MYTATLIPKKQDLNNLYLKNKMSQPEIGKMYGVSQKVVFRWCRELGLKKIAKKRNQYGIMNHYWSGDNPEYTTLHKRVEAKYGRPNKCELCPSENDNIVYEWANISGNYINVDDFVRACRSCHRYFDKYKKEVMF